MFSFYSPEFVGGDHGHYSEKTFLVIRTIGVLAPGLEEIVLIEDGVDEHPADVRMHVT